MNWSRQLLHSHTSALTWKLCNTAMYRTCISIEFLWLMASHVTDGDTCRVHGVVPHHDSHGPRGCGWSWRRQDPDQGFQGRRETRGNQDNSCGIANERNGHSKDGWVGPEPPLDFRFRFDRLRTFLRGNQKFSHLVLLTNLMGGNKKSTKTCLEQITYALIYLIKYNFLNTKIF